MPPGRLRTWLIVGSLGTAALLAGTVSLASAGAGDIPTVAGPTASASMRPTQGHGAATVRAIDVLATLEVKGRAPKTGYDRTALFGEAWLDVHGNGCDTRNDILARDLSEIVVDAQCRVLVGLLKDPYTGTTISFRCAYVARQISVKAAYGLSVTAPEHEAMARVLARCPDQRSGLL